MKTLKLLFALCIILVFTSNAVNAQAEVIRKYVINIAHFNCMTEDASGEIRWQTVEDGNKRFVLIQGDLIGVETGNFYKFKYEINVKDIFNENNYQEVYSGMSNIIVHCNNKLIGRLVGISHVTFNANGELTAYFDQIVDW